MTLDSTWAPALIRLLLLFGDALAIGSLTMEGIVLRRALPCDERPWTRRAWALGLAMVLASAPLEFFQKLWAMTAGDPTFMTQMVLPMVTAYSGRVLIFRMAGVLLSALLWWALRRFRGPWLALGLALLLALGMSLDGHAVDPGLLTPLLAIDVIHVVAAGGWWGGVLLLWDIAGKADEAHCLPLARGFSELAIVLFPLAVVTGVVNAVYHLFPRVAIPELFGYPYGQLLLVKTALVLVVFALAANLKERMLPALARDCGHRTHFRRWLLLELTVGIAILTLTGFLTQSNLLPPGTGAGA